MSLEKEYICDGLMAFGLIMILSSTIISFIMWEFNMVALRVIGISTFTLLLGMYLRNKWEKK